MNLLLRMLRCFIKKTFICRQKMTYKRTVYLELIMEQFSMHISSVNETVISNSVAKP